MERLKIKASEVKHILPEELSPGNYVYAESDMGESRLCYVHLVNENVVTITPCSAGIQDKTEPRGEVARDLNELCVVAITEDWFKVNSDVFHPCPDAVKIYDQNVAKYAKVAWCYAFESKLTPHAIYYVFGIQISYMDSKKYTELLDSGATFLEAQGEACGKAQIVQVALKFQAFPNSPVPFMNISMLHQLQNFLTLHGIPDAFKVVPESLID